ncbi:MAG: hypothetical protein SO072_13340 [Dysosmobacter sp.]|nr:hypothetical protein [Dysosmobacter sp.]
MEKLHYTIVLKSMIGPRSGSLLLQIHGNTVTGTLELLGHRNRFSGTVLQPGKYLISGSLSTNVEKMEYDAVLHTEEERLTGGFVTASGCWEVEGFLRAKNPLARAKRAE